MRIQVRQWDGQGSFDDPKAGKPLTGSPQAVASLLLGRAVTGVGGVSPDTDRVVINLQGMNVWFMTDGGVPRILFQKYPA